jgi:predicted RNA-binding Zn-ribbon protein involved in translation (DUF1610 family)
VTAAQSVLALLVVLLALVPAAAGVIWYAGTRLIGRPGSRRQAGSPDEVAPLVALDVGGFASGAAIAAYSARERQFVVGVVAPLAASGRLALVPKERVEEPAARAAVVADREVPLAAFYLVCPACGTSLGSTADVAHFIGSCPSCSRRVASRRRGSRVAHATSDAARPGREP